MKGLAGTAVVLLALGACAAHAQGFCGVFCDTTSTSTSVGSTKGMFVNTTQYIGAAGGTTIAVGDLGTCTLSASPPLNGYGSCPIVGSGTPSDPFLPPCLSSCSMPGSMVLVAAAAQDFNTNTYTVTAAGTASAIPLGHWVPIGSSIGLVLAALAWWRFRGG